MIDLSLLNGVVNVSADGVFYKGFQQSSDNDTTGLGNDGVYHWDYSGMKQIADAMISVI